MDKIELLCNILNCFGSNQIFKLKYNNHEIIFQELLDLGLVFETINNETVYCTKCDNHHPADIITINDILKWRCPETGFHEVSRGDQLQYKVNIERLINLVQEALNKPLTKSHDIKTKISNLYRIDGETFLYLSNNNPSKNDDLSNYINDNQPYNRSNGYSGLVVSTFIEFSNKEYKLPRGHSAIPFIKAFSFCDDRLVFNKRGLENFLPSNGINYESKEVGRPSELNKIVDVYKTLCNKDNNFVSLSKRKRAKSIHNYLNNPLTPSEKTIYNKLTDTKNIDLFEMPKTMPKTPNIV